MNGQDFLRITNEALAPFLREMGFLEDTPSISGRLYRVSYSSPEKVVSVSYEPGDNAMFTMVFSKEGGELSDIDDRTKTPRLSDLNSRYMRDIAAEDRENNEIYFRRVSTKGRVENLVLKVAKELRLVLPKYLDAMGRG